MVARQKEGKEQGEEEETGRSECQGRQEPPKFHDVTNSNARTLRREVWSHRSPGLPEPNETEVDTATATRLQL